MALSRFRRRKGAMMGRGHLAQVLACFGLVLLASCGGAGGYGGGGAGPANASPGGIWNGTESVSGLQVTGLVDESGDAHFIRSDGVQYVGTVLTSGNSISANVDGYTPIGTAFPDGSTHGTGTVTGTISARVSVTANTKFTTDKGTLTTGTLDLTFNQLYNQASSLATIAGNYMETATGDIVSIDAAGAITAQDPNSGCVINGTVTIINASYNAYGIQVTYASCVGAAAVLNGVIFRGLATLDTNTNPVQTIAGVTGSAGGVTYAIVYTLNHQ